MENLYSVRIIRSENQVVPGVYIKEFWMLCGIYVDEAIMEREDISEDRSEVDINIILNRNKLHHNQFKARHNIVIEKESDIKDLSSRDKRLSFGKKIEKYLLKIPDILGWEANWKSDFEIVYKAFVESDFAYHNYLTHLFLDQFDMDMKLTQLEILDNCADKIYSRKAKVEGLLYRRFAYFNCARKINRVCDSLETKRVFNDEKVMEAAHQLSIEDEQFTMGNVLAGLIGLSRRELWLSGELYMQKAVVQEKGIYNAFVYYALAHYYEIDKKDKIAAWRIYERMRDVDSHNYCMLFKFAAHEFYKKNYRKFCKNFFQIYSMIEEWIGKGWIQPLELEYCYKCAKILNKIPANKSIALGIQPISNEDIERIENDYFGESNFMNNFIFNDCIKEVHKRYFRKKMMNHKLSDIINEI